MSLWDYVKAFYRGATTPVIPDEYKEYVKQLRVREYIAPQIEPEPQIVEPTGLYPISLLNDSVMKSESQAVINNNIRTINQVFKDFDINAIARSHTELISSIRYNVELFGNTSVANVEKRIKDLKLTLDIDNISFTRKNGYLGIVVEKENRSIISLKEVLCSKEYRNSPIQYIVALGIDDNNRPVICDLEEWENVLIGGSKGSGKSSTEHSIMLSLLFKLSPSEIQFMLIDLKHSELPKYNGIPHLMAPVVEDLETAKAAFEELNQIMEERNRLLGKYGVNKLSQLNEELDKPLPRIVCLIDEYSMLMNSKYKNDFNALIGQLTAVGRASGIHVILITQNPNSNIVDSTISANFTTRIALKVTDHHKSQVILDESGAEELLGKGDMILSEERRTVRLQGCYVDKEIRAVVNHLKQDKPDYIDFEPVEAKPKRDAKYDKAKSLIIGEGKCSVSMLRDNLGIGYPRALKIIKQLQEYGVVGEYIESDKTYEILLKEG